MQTTNQVIIRGFVGAAPKSFSGAVKVNVATKNWYYDKDDKRQEETEWVTITILSKKMIEFVSANVTAGDYVFVEGRIKNGSYKNKDTGETMHAVDIVASSFDVMLAKAVDAEKA